MDELGEDACFSGCSSGREDGPEINRRQRPILQHDLDRAVFDFGREHPFRSDCDTGVGEYEPRALPRQHSHAGDPSA